MVQVYSRALIEIDHHALKHNLYTLRKRAPHASFLAVLKSNAYGHGLLSIAQALHEADGFGVACISEAIQLRQAGITQKILVLEGCLTAQEYQLAAQYQLDVTIHHTLQLQWLLDCRITQPLVIWLKLNTGMNRLGFSEEALKAIWPQLKKCPLVSKLVLMSHFASADHLDRETTLLQLNQFKSRINSLDITAPISLANSAAVLEWPETHYHWVRPGLALYGVSPFLKTHALQYDLRPVMTLQAKLIAIQNLKRGDAIGYHGRSVCDSDRCIGIVALGYGDGYPHDAPDGTPVLLNNQRVPLMGRVSMDMLTIDLTQYPEATIGDSVILWGRGLPIEEVAHHTGRSTYELLCGIQRQAGHRLALNEIGL
jgi:alanine racemase